MDTDFIDALIALMRRNAVTELEYETEDVRLRLRLDGAGIVAPSASPTEVSPDSRDPCGIPDPAGGMIEVRAPMAGCLYTAPEPEAAPYVAVGDPVTPGQTLALLEAMKMFTPVE